MNWFRLNMKKSRAVLMCSSGMFMLYGLRYRHTLPNKYEQFEQLNDALLQPIESEKKRIIVIGGGISGVGTALSLAKRGHQVIILEAASEISSECSNAPAGAMQRANPKVDRAFFFHTLKSLLPKFSLVSNENKSSDSFKFFHIDWFKTSSDPHFLRWMSQFAWHSIIGGGHKKRQDDMLNFTNLAIDSMVETITSEFPNIGKIGHLNASGALKIHLSEKEYQNAIKTGAWSLGATDSEPTYVIPRTKVLELEPWLNNVKSSKSIYGGTLQPEAMRANCPDVTKALANICTEKYGVQIFCDTRVIGFRVNDRSEVVGIKTTKGRCPIDHDTQVVVACGSWTPNILRQLKIYVPVYPLKGYDLLVNLPTNLKHIAERIVSIDHTYLTRFGNQLRICSIGEFDGWNTKPNEKIAQSVKDEAMKVLPNELTESVQNANVVCGLRPMVANGVVLCGKAPKYSNVWINCGPGFNGWKIGIGTGNVISDLIEGKKIYGFDPTTLDPQQNGTKYSPLYTSLCQIRGIL